MSDYDERIVAFDSNILTYFLDGNRGSYRLAPDDPITDQRVAAVRLFMYCKTTIVPAVKAEAFRISNPDRREEHISFIDNQFAEFIPDERQQKSIQRRADELLAYHPKRPNDCRILAEVEEDGDIPVLVSWDKAFRTDLAQHTRVRLESPVECWERFGIPRGTAPQWTPYGDHPLTNQDWWRWENENLTNEPAKLEKRLEVTNQPQTPPMLLEYQRGMEEIRLRFDFVALQHNEVAAMGTVETPAARFRLETGFAHLRKVLELIAFSSVMAHKDVYVAAYTNYQKHYKAKDMLDAVEKLNPGFYPIAFDFDASIKHFTPVTDGWLTREEFIELYDCASDLVHAGNPYAEKQVYLRLRLDQWIGRIRRLLEWHGVAFPGDKERLMVNVPSDLTQPVQVLLAVEKPDGATERK